MPGMDSTKLIMLGLCVLSETIFFQKIGKSLGVKIWETALWMVFFNVSAVITSHSFGIIERGDLSGFSIMRMSGAILLMPIPFWLVIKIKKWPLKKAFDILTLLFVMGLILMRVNCVLYGCCKGVMIPGLNIPLPIRGAEILMFALFLIRYTPRVMADTTDGILYPLLMIWYGVFRFIVEWFRKEYITAFGPIHWAHIWAILLLCIGLSVYNTMTYTYKKKQNNGRKH